MQKVIIDGKEYLLVPSEQLKPVEETLPNEPQSLLSDFLEESGTEVLQPPIDDGLSTNQEKQDAIKITVQGNNPQDVVTSGLPAVPKATSKPYAYREKYLNKELMPSDVMTFSRLSQAFLDSNPEDPMIKSDKLRPKSQRLFYGPSTEQEG